MPIRRISSAIVVGAVVAFAMIVSGDPGAAAASIGADGSPEATAGPTEAASPTSPQPTTPAPTPVPNPAQSDEPTPDPGGGPTPAPTATPSPTLIATLEPSPTATPAPVSTPAGTPAPIPGGPNFHLVLNIDPAHPVSGDVVTLTPVWPEGYAIPTSAHCRWSLSWGNDAALSNRAWDETFGAVEFAGPASGGYCGAWVFTLPYSAAGQWLYTFMAQIADGLVLGHEETLLHGSNGAPRVAGIATSNLPLGWLSLSARPTAGTPVTATLHQVGGYVAPRNGHWTAQGGSGPGFITGVVQGSGGSVWTFTPTNAGTWTVFYNAPGTGLWGDDLMAAIDPRIAPAAQKLAASPAVTPASAAPTAGASPGPAQRSATPGMTAGAPSQASPARTDDGSPQPIEPTPASGAIGGVGVALLLGVLAVSALVGTFMRRRRLRSRATESA